MASHSSSRQLFVFLWVLFVLLHNPRCTFAAEDGSARSVNATLLPSSPMNSSIDSVLPFTAPPTILPSPATGAACQKLFVNITVDPPRVDCMPGLMVSVPICSGACNSYVRFLKASPYKESECSCCKATTYSLTKRIITFQCGSTTHVASYNIAAVIYCGCNSCR